MIRIEVNVMTGESIEVELTPEEIAALPPPAPFLMPEISARQLRLALLAIGISGAQVEAKIATMPGHDQAREAALIEWEYATTFRRDHQLLVALGQALNMTDAQIDDAWRNAATL